MTILIAIWLTVAPSQHHVRVPDRSHGVAMQEFSSPAACEKARTFIGDQQNLRTMCVPK